MSAAAPETPRTRHRGSWHYSSVHLLCALVLLLAVTPFVEGSPNGSLIETALTTIVLVSAGLALGGQRHVLVMATVLLVPAVITNWMHHLFPTHISPATHLVFSLVFIAFVLVYILRFILQSRRVDVQVVCAGVSVYLMMGLLWSFAYLLVAQVTPNAFSIQTDPGEPRTMDGFNALYFSLSSLSTLGFGDIIPVSRVARMLAVMEAMTGMLYVATLISRLVSMYTPPAPSGHDRPHS